MKGPSDLVVTPVSKSEALRHTATPGAVSTFALAAAAEAERRWLLDLFTSLGSEPARLEQLVSRRTERRLIGPRWGERRRFPRA